MLSGAPTCCSSRLYTRSHFDVAELGFGGSRVQIPPSRFRKTMFDREIVKVPTLLGGLRTASLGVTQVRQPMTDDPLEAVAEFEMVCGIPRVSTLAFSARMTGRSSSRSTQCRGNRFAYPSRRMQQTRVAYHVFRVAAKLDKAGSLPFKLNEWLNQSFKRQSPPRPT